MKIYLLCYFLIIVQSKDIFTKVTTKNFDMLKSSSDHLIIELFLKNCPQCEKFAHAINSAAQKVLKYVEGRNISVTFGTINGDEETDLIDRFTPDGKSMYPVAWMFSIHRTDGVGPMVYDSDTDENEIFDWIVSRLEPEIAKLEGSEVDAWIAKAQKNLGIILFTSETMKHQFSVFFDFAADHPQYEWAYTEDVEKVLEHAKHESIVMYMNFDEGKEVFSHELTYQVFSKWVNHNSVPSLLAFDDRVIDFMFEQGNAILIILYDPDRHEKELREIEVYSDTLRHHGLKFTSLDIHNEHYFELSGFLGVRNSDQIEVAIINPSDKFKKYLLQGKPTIQNLSNFITDFIYGKLTPQTVSKQPVPELPEITADSFEQYVINNDKDVFLYIYSPTCPYSKEFNPEFEALINLLSVNENILLYKLDGTENDPPEYVEINGYPTINFFKRDDKFNPQIYNQDMKAFTILLYLKEHVSYEWVEIPELNDFITRVQNQPVPNVDPREILNDL